MAIFLVKSTDVGAPALNSVNGGFITVVDYVLVTVAGYSKIYSGTNKGIYIPPNGLGYSIRFVHDTGVSGTANGVGVRGVESASDVDTLVNPYPSVAQVGNTLSIWPIGSNTTGSRDYFFLVSDGASTGIPPFIYYGPDASISACSSLYFWGDVSPQEAGDNYCSVITIRNSLMSNGISNSLTMNNCVQVANTPKLYWARSRDGALVGSLGAMNEIGSTGGLAQTPLSPHPDTGGIIKRKTSICDIYATSGTTPGASFHMNRGWLPNFWSCVSAGGSTAYNLYDLFEDGNYDPTATFMYIPSGVATSSAYTTILEITTTWRKPLT